MRLLQKSGASDIAFCRNFRKRLFSLGVLVTDFITDYVSMIYDENIGALRVNWFDVDIPSVNFRFAMGMAYSMLMGRRNVNWLIESPAKTLEVEDREWLEEFYYKLLKELDRNMICAIIQKSDNFKDNIITASWTSKFRDYNITGEYFTDITEAEKFLMEKKL